MTESQDFGLPNAAINSIACVLAKHSNIQQAILYGSRAMGTHRPNSDIDLCLVGPELPLTELLAIETELDDLLLPYKIDMSLHRSIDNPALLDHIRRVGVVFYSRNDSAGARNLKAPPH